MFRIGGVRLVQSVLLILISVFLSACSGDSVEGDDGSGSGTGSGGSTTYSLTAEMLNSDGNAADSFAEGASVTIRATLSADGAGVSGQIITFALSDSDFAQLSGTNVATDGNGVAEVTLTGTATAGNGTVTVATQQTLDGATEQNLAFSSLGSQNQGSDDYSYEAYLVPSSTEYSEYANISASTLTTISSANPGTVLVRFTTSDGTPLVNSLVTISLLDEASGLATLSNDLGTVLTDANGIATLNIIATDVSGAGYIQVSFDDGTTNRIAFASAGDGNQQVAVEIGSIELLASSVQLASSGSDEIELLALVKDNQNNLLSGVEVDFNADSGNIQVVSSTTADNGVATAKLNTLNNPESRTITVSSFVGDDSDSVTINVTGTSIKITGNSSVVTGDEVEMTVVLLDSDGNGIPQTNIFIASAADNSLTNIAGQPLPTFDDGSGTMQTYVTTDSTGSAAFSFSADNSGVDTLSANALGESGSLNISVSPDSFVIDSLTVAGEVVDDTDVPLSGGQVTLSWLRDNAAFDGDVLFSSTRGQVVDTSDNPITGAVSTGADGQVTVGIISSDAGPAILTASAEGLSASFEFEFVAETAHQIDLQASPFSIGPNGQKSTISAVVRDKDGNLVKNRPVNFRLFDVSGGSIFPASDTTDSNGLATTVYTSNSVSANDGVVVAACTDIAGDASECVNILDDQGDDNRQNDVYSCTESGECVQDHVGLTVADRELFIALGTGNTIGSANDQEYEKVFSVIVTDADSNPVEGVELSVSALPDGYFEGAWGVVLNEDGDFDHYSPFSSGYCPNEDVDRDGVLDRIEDVDGDGVFSTVDEDLDDDGNLDRGEDVNDNGVLDDGEDINGNGTLDLTEDLNGDGNLDVDEDLDNDGNIDVNEDIDGDGVFDREYEDLDGDCILDAGEDLNADGNLDVGEDLNCNGILDQGEDVDGDGVLDTTEDLDGDGRHDRTNEDVDNDGRLDEFNEDIDGDGHFDNVNEDVNNDLELDVIEVDYNQNGVADSDGINEDINSNGTLEPGNVVAVLGNLTTDASGTASVAIRYAETFGGWVRVRLSVTAKVSGTEYLREEVFTLPYSAEDTTNENNPPTHNQFGSDGNCATIN